MSSLDLKGVFQKVAQESRLTSFDYRQRGRGQFRRKLGLSSARLKRLLKKQDLEQTIERIWVALMKDDPQRHWFNQFNLTSGVESVLGLRGSTREAVDLGWLPEPKWDCVHFYELKINHSHSPQRALEQLFRYACWLVFLRQRRIPPFDAREWRTRRIELQLAGPAEYFRTWGYGTCFGNWHQEAQNQLAKLQKSEPILYGVSFTPVPHQFAPEFNADALLECIYRETVETYVHAEPQGELHPLEIIRPQCVDQLRKWLENHA